ncbi:MAG: hypothetical protein JSR91_00175 [Proteobacteria bacterium]|nr:hypothetical protein [Pseudomonadota bacterium]
MTATLFLPFYVAIDGNGVPMVGAKLYFYTTGTTTPQATYADSGLLTPNSNPVVADADGRFPPIYLGPGDDYKAILKTSADVIVETIDPIFAPATPASLPAIRSYLAGLTLSTAGSSASFSVAAGSASDDTNAVTMNLAAMSKNTNSWAAGAGNGALDTGTVAINTWYHVFVIQRSDTGGSDVLISTSVSSPALPTNYTYKRRIGSMKTDGSGNWMAFVQDGDLFQWNNFVSDVSSNAPGTTAVTRTLSVPPGVNVLAGFIWSLTNLSTSNGCRAYFSDLATADATGSETADVASASGNVFIARGRLFIRTNMSSQIRSLVSGLGDSNVTLAMTTIGWIDRRGRDA